MPGRDGTGPTGRGSRTGRGMGNCTSTGSNPNPVSNVNRPYEQRLGLWDASLGAGDVIAETAVIKDNCIVNKKGENNAWYG